MPVIEIIDSWVKDWRISIADNASSGGLLQDGRTAPGDFFTAQLAGLGSVSSGPQRGA
jgi:2-keto-4-pentenoate hydratase